MKESPPDVKFRLLTQEYWGDPSIPNTDDDGCVIALRGHVGDGCQVDPIVREISPQGWEPCLMCRHGDGDPGNLRNISRRGYLSADKRFEYTIDDLKGDKGEEPQRGDSMTEARWHPESDAELAHGEAAATPSSG
jgi:hypothetical protein